MKKISVVLICFLSFLVLSCHRAEPELDSWSVFTYEEYQGRLYASHFKDRVYIVLCGNFAGIEASLKLNHACTQEQFEIFKEKLVEAGCESRGEAEKPDVEGYPDLSQYLTFVFSSDELHDLWAQFGLEE
jgi:hypothetical protein